MAEEIGNSQEASAPATLQDDAAAQREAALRELMVRLFGRPIEWDDYYGDKLNLNRGKDYACGVCI